MVIAAPCGIASVTAVTAKLVYDIPLTNAVVSVPKLESDDRLNALATPFDVTNPPFKLPAEPVPNEAA